MENLLTFCATRVHTDVGEDVFFFCLFCFYWIQGHLARLRLGWHLLVISFFMEGCITAGPRGCFSTFLAQMTSRSQKKGNMLMLSSSSSLSLFLSPSGFHCISSLNDSVTVPHQRMSHSTTLLLWWFLPSVYYIMQQRVLLSYIHHNKHSPSASISTEQRVY